MSLRRNWDLLAVVLLVVAAIPAPWVLPKSLVMVPWPGFMDDDWHLDAAFKASRGIWIGRDVAFTHGPLFQWLSSLPARSIGVSTGAIYATWNTVPVWCTIIFTCLTLRLLMPGRPPWKRFLLLLLLCIFWSPSLRIAYSVLVFAACFWSATAAAERRTKFYWPGLLTAALIAFAFLLAADTGIFAIAGLLAAVAGVAFEFRSNRAALTGIFFTLMSAGLAFFAASMAVNVMIAGPLDFRYWKDSLALVGAYRWATPYRMSTAGAVRLLGGLVCGAAAIIIGAIARRWSASVTARSSLLLGSGLFCLAVMQSALVRSDEHHVAIALYPIVVLTGVILLGFESKRASLLFAAVMLGASVLFGELRTGVAAPATLEAVAFAPAITSQLLSELRHPMRTCPAGFSEFDRACFENEFAGLLRSCAAFLQENSSPQDAIAIFPYQTRYGLAARRDVAGGLLQAYIASGAALSRMEIMGLEQSQPPAGLYFPDPDFTQLTSPEAMRWRANDFSLRVDGVSNFTRAPEVWFWMQRHYRARRQLAEGAIGLQHDDARATRVSLQQQPLLLPLRPYAIDGRRVALDLGSPAWPATADFIRLRLLVRYPFWWRLLKPERMQLEIVHADGTRELQWFVLPPEISSEVWFYPWKQSTLANYFDANPAHWRMGAGSSIVSLKLWVAPLDWTSQRPDSITLEAADAITLAMER